MGRGTDSRTGEANRTWKEYFSGKAAEASLPTLESLQSSADAQRAKAEEYTANKESATTGKEKHRWDSAAAAANEAAKYLDSAKLTLNDVQTAKSLGEEMKANFLTQQVKALQKQADYMIQRSEVRAAGNMDKQAVKHLDTACKTIEVQLTMLNEAIQIANALTSTTRTLATFPYEIEKVDLLKQAATQAQKTIDHIKNATQAVFDKNKSAFNEVNKRFEVSKNDHRRLKKAADDFLINYDRRLEQEVNAADFSDNED